MQNDEDATPFDLSNTCSTDEALKDMLREPDSSGDESEDEALDDYLEPFTVPRAELEPDPRELGLEESGFE